MVAGTNAWASGERVRERVDLSKEVTRPDAYLESSLCTNVPYFRPKTFEQILGEEGVSAPYIIEFYSIDVIKRTLTAGVGVTVLPKIAVAEEVAQKQLVMLPWSEGEIEVAILMVWYRDKWLSPTLQAFMDVTRRVMARDR